jgi:murein DD-endopeptidase MepM/ murein hydrolase activator NlpD
VTPARGAALAALLPLAVGLAACVGTAPAPPRRNPCEGKLAVSGRSERERFALEARNDCHVPVVFEVSFEALENLRPSRELPARLSVPPHASAPVLELAVVRPDRSSSYRVASRVMLGGEPRPDPAARYAFPFGGGTPRKLSQGVDGAETHRGLHRYAFDFDLPIGTPVLAAREGVVFQVQDGFGEGGTRESDERGNMVVIWHADGTFAIYGHLRKGVCAREGERVAAGDFLGWSGNSGYTSGPHLHFAVGVAAGEDGSIQSLPILFEGDLVPEEGRAYGSAVSGARAAPEGSRCDAPDGRDS